MAAARRGSLTRILTGILPILALVTVGSPHRPPQTSPWWEVRCVLTVRGDYSVTDLDTTFNGEFQYKARWEGAMEQDGPDFRLFHVKIDVLTWEIGERTVPQETDASLLTEREAPQKPAFGLDYIVREGPDLLFSLGVEGLLIPLASSPEKFDLLLPRTKKAGAERAGYDDFITKGTNAVVVGEEGLGEKSLEKTFAWEWKRRQWTVRGRGAVKLAETHKAIVVITIVRHD
jgi:hypothetical protein